MTDRPGRPSDGLRAGVVGFGKMGRLRAELVRAHPRLVLDSVCDPNPVSSAESGGVPAFTDPREVLARKPELLFVATPNHATAETVVAGLEAGCHVFSEKPPGRSSEEADRMIEAERRHAGQVLKRRTLKSILADAGLSVEDPRRLL